MKKKCMDKGSKERSPPHNLGRNWVNTYAVRITMLIADIEDDIMDPVMQCTTLPSHSGFSQKKLVSFVTEIHTTSIDFLTPRDSLNIPDHRIHKDGDGDALFQLKLDSLPHAHAYSTKIFYKHQDLKNQESSNFGFPSNNDKTLNESLLDLKKVERYMVRSKDDEKELVEMGEVGEGPFGEEEGGERGRL
ncbi:hypothetical protein Tco_0681359 [Tanacetum coccineum]|uniref:Uncharacterized protein n=1 Tax=Tanacetum coccineum TaxID=301880 RepID=A0ABQ4XNC7_9ASTR